MTLRDMGLSNKKIAKNIDRSLSVNNFMRLGKKYATKKSTDLRKKCSHRDKGKILQAHSRNKLNASQIKRKLDLPIVVRP